MAILKKKKKPKIKPNKHKNNTTNKQTKNPHHQNQLDDCFGLVLFFSRLGHKCHGKSQRAKGC